MYEHPGYLGKIFMPVSDKPDIVRNALPLILPSKSIQQDHQTYSITEWVSSLYIINLRSNKWDIMGEIESAPVLSLTGYTRV